MIVHVVRDGKVDRPPTVRDKFKIRREVVYARRSLKQHGLEWQRTPMLVTRAWKLEVGGIVAIVYDHGLFSYGYVEVDKEPAREWHHEESFAGLGGVNRAALRTTQHVLMLLEERSADAERRLRESA